MGNIMIAIKRFFQNKNTVTIIAILAAVGIIYFAYNYRIKKSTEPVNVPYATKELGPRTLITNEMVSTRKVPGGIVTKNVITNVNSIVGRYVSNKAVIPEGSMFYENTVIDWKDFPSSIFAHIPDGQTVYALRVTQESTYGNSIFPGNYIDIYYKTSASTAGGKVWVGKFIESIRVLDVEDDAGNSVFETAGTPGKPAKLIFNVPDKVFLLLKKIDNMNDISLFPVQRNAEYSKNPSETRIVGNEFKRYVESRAVDDTVVLGGSK